MIASREGLTLCSREFARGGEGLSLVLRREERRIDHHHRG